MTEKKQIMEQRPKFDLNTGYFVGANGNPVVLFLTT